MEKREFKYTYNKEQSLFFVKNGAELVDYDIHKKTKMIFFKFVNNDRLQELYKIWNSNKRNK